MTAALGRSPLCMGRTYRDRRDRRWRVVRVTNAGKVPFTAACLPSMALVTCIEPDAAKTPETRHAQWLFADTGCCFAQCQADIDLVRAA